MGGTRHENVQRKKEFLWSFLIVLHIGYRDIQSPYVRNFVSEKLGKNPFASTKLRRVVRILSRPLASYSVRSRERQVTKLRTPHPSLIALSHDLREEHAGTSVNLNQQPQVKKLSPIKTFQETSKMAVFTLEDALSVWSNFGKDSFFVWLFRSQV